MEDVTKEFLEAQGEAEEKSRAAVRALGLEPDEEREFLAYLSNGRGSIEEEERYYEETGRPVLTRAVGSKYTNSPMVKYTCLSPNCNSPRNHAIDTITIHEVWGECTMKQLGDIFLPWSRQASSNYGCCTDGVALFVNERDRAWTSGDAANDNRAITIEVSNSRTYPNPVSNNVYQLLIRLCADICKRNGKTKMVWCGSLAKTKARNFAPNEMRMTLHKWFQATDCPGVWLENHMQDIADQVNRILKPIVYPATPFAVKVLIDDLNIRKGAGTNYSTNGYAPKGNVIIEEVKNDFGRLSTGKGWIYLGSSNYVTIGEHIEDGSVFKDVKTTDKYYHVYKKLQDLGIMKANSKGNFRPKAKVTRGTLAIVIYRLLKFLGKI